MARKMKDSGIEWIGEIPEGWEIKRLGAILQERNEVNNPIQTTSILSLTNNRGVIPYSEKGNQGNKAKDDLTGYKIAHIGDIVLNSMNVIIGSVGLSNYYGAVSPVYYMLFPRNNIETNIQYYNYLFQTTAFQQSLRGYGNGILEIRMRIQMQKLKTVLLPVPTFLEQSNITVYLDASLSKLNILLSKTRSSIEEYKKLKQAVITQAVTKGVHGEREMKDSGVDYIGKIPSEWFFCKLRNVGDTQNGISKSSEFFGKGFPFVSYSDVYKNYSLPFAVSGLVESTPEEQERYSVKEGDIFFTRTSETIEEVGFSCVCEKDIPNATFAGFLIRVRPFSDKLHTPYAKYYFRSSHLRFYLVKEMNLVTRASLGQSLLKSMPVLLPPLEEQKEIADYLDAKCAEIDGLIAKKEQLVKELESYKKSLIYEVVTGKREV